MHGLSAWIASIAPSVIALAMRPSWDAIALGRLAASAETPSSDSIATGTPTSGTSSVGNAIAASSDDRRAPTASNPASMLKNTASDMGPPWERADHNVDDAEASLPSSSTISPTAERTLAAQIPPFWGVPNHIDEIWRADPPAGPIALDHGDDRLRDVRATGALGFPLLPVMRRAGEHGQLRRRRAPRRHRPVRRSRRVHRDGRA